MEYNDNSNNMMGEGMVLKEKKGGSMGWIWWIIGILILLGLLWYFFGQSSDNVEIIDEVGQEAVVDGSGEMAYDENGLPLMGPLAPISNAMVEVSESFPVQVALLVSGDLLNGCTYLNSPAQTRDGNTFYVNLTTRTEGEVCTEALVPFERRIPLDTAGLPAGAYMVDINGQLLSFELAQENQIDFEVASEK